MTETTNRQVLLASQPVGEPTSDNFRLVQTPVPEPGPGEFLARTIFLSIDPYMRGRMSDAKSYAEPVALDGLMTGGTVSEVVASNHREFAAGDIVFGYLGWQSHAVSDGTGVIKVDPAVAPISTALGVMGMPGLTAYVGLLDIGQPKEGETVVVAAASGPVGSVVGQIAKLKGCRVVGIAGAADKCAFVQDELGFDAGLSHRSDSLPDDLAAACPDGIDVYYENAGGKVFDAVLPLMNVGGRIPVCGLVANYNLTELPIGPDRIPPLMRSILVNRLKIQGFIIFDHAHRRAAFEAEMGRWLKDGTVKYREDRVQGLEKAPEALISVLAGRNFGKMVVQVGDDPTEG